MRYALRIDANQSQVVSALTAAGANVLILGLPVDLLIGTTNKRGERIFAFFEVKDGDKPKSAQKKTKVQEMFFAQYEGWPVCLVDSAETALRHLRVLQS